MPDQPPIQTDEVNPTQLDVEEKPELAEEKYEIASDELTSGDEKLGQQWISLGLIGGWFVVKNKLDEKFAYDKLKNIDAKQLLNLKDPSYFANIRAAHGLERNGTNILTSLNASNPYHMDQLEVRRRTYALVVGRKLHREVNNREIDYRIDRIAARYGLDETSSKQLNSDIREWMAKNPGKNLDNELVVRATNISLSQGGTKEELDLKEKQYREDAKDSRNKAVEQMEKDGVTGRAEDVVNKTLDKNSSPPSPSKINTEMEYIFSGEKTETGKPTSETKNATYFGGRYYAPDQIEVSRHPAVIDPKAGTSSEHPIMPPHSPSSVARISQSRFSLPGFLRSGLSNIASRFNTLFNGLRNRLNLLSSGFSRMFSPIINGLKSKIMGFAMKTLGGAAIKHLIANVIAPGIGSAVVVAAEGLKKIAKLFGIDIDELIMNKIKDFFTKFLIPTIMTIAVVVIFIIIFSLMLGAYGLSKLLPVNNSSNINILGFNPNQTWEIFEKDYLAVKKTKNQPLVTWQQFENEFLTPQKNYISLNEK